MYVNRRQLVIPKDPPRLEALGAEMPTVGQSTFQLYPNPATHILNLDLTHYLKQEISISIFNHLGQQVLHLPKQVLLEPVIAINLLEKEMSDGIYFLSVRTAEGQEGKPFVIAR